MDTDRERFARALGAQIAAEMGAARSNKSKLAKDLGISRSALDHYIKGEREPSAPMVYSISATLGVPAPTIMQRAIERMEAGHF